MSGANPDDPAPVPRGGDDPVRAPDPEAQVMLRVQAGDPAAFRALVDRWVRPLFSFFRRLGADAAQAEDCAQEVFLRLYRTRAAYVPRARFSTYLFSIARHLWIDVVRHESAGPDVLSADAMGDAGGDDEAALSARLPGREGDPSAGAREAELADALRAGVALLSEEQRAVFALARSEALPYPEIGRILGIPVGTVKSRMHAAVTALRDHLRRAGFEP